MGWAMDDKDFREIDAYLIFQRKLAEETENAGKMVAGFFNTLVQHGVPEQWAAYMTSFYFWALTQKGK